MTASGAGDAREVAESAANSRPMGWLARIGLTARGLVYIVVGWLAVLVGLGGRANIDQRGALTEVLAQPYGAAMLWLLTIGFAAYALWRLSEAAFGATGEGKKAGPRLRSLARGIAYVAMAFTARSLLQGARGTQAGQQGHLAGTVMQHPGGRWIVGIVGLIVVAVGLVLVREGWTTTFLRYFGALPPQAAEGCRVARTSGHDRARCRVRSLRTARRGRRVDGRPREGRRRRSGIPHPVAAAVRDRSRGPTRSGPLPLRRLRAHRGRLAPRD